MKNTFFVGQPNFNQDPHSMSNGIGRSSIWNDVESMNEDIINFWNETVTPEDDVFVIGNFTNPSNNSIQIMNKLNGRIFYINNESYTEDNIYDQCDNVTQATSMNLLKNELSIYLTNNLEHLNTIDSNFIITSCNRNLLEKINSKQIYFRNKRNNLMYINNLHIPVFNVNIDIWDYRPINLKTILDLYIIYRKDTSS